MRDLRAGISGSIDGALQLSLYQLRLSTGSEQERDYRQTLHGPPDAGQGVGYLACYGHMKKPHREPAGLGSNPLYGVRPRSRM
jgi:hypothetical protein